MMLPAKSLWKPSFLSNFTFTEVISIESLCILQVQEGICVFLWGSLALQSVEKFPLLCLCSFFLCFAIYSSRNLCSLYSRPQPTALFSRIYSYLSDALAPRPLSQDLSAYTHVLSLSLSSPDQPFGSGAALYSHPTWHNGHLIYVYTSYNTAVWFRYLNTLWQPQHCLGRLKAPHQCINTPRRLYMLCKQPALHPHQRKGVGKKNLHLPTQRVILAKHVGGIKLIILSCFISRNILPSSNILVSLYQVDTGSVIPKSTRKFDRYINNMCL